MFPVFVIFFVSLLASVFQFNGEIGFGRLLPHFLFMFILFSSVLRRLFDLRTIDCQL